jgi:hypothetical protein
MAVTAVVPMVTTFAIKSLDTPASVKFAEAAKYPRHNLEKRRFRCFKMVVPSFSPLRLEDPKELRV